IVFIINIILLYLYLYHTIHHEHHHHHLCYLSMGPPMHCGHIQGTLSLLINCNLLQFSLTICHTDFSHLCSSLSWCCNLTLSNHSRHFHNFFNHFSFFFIFHLLSYTLSSLFTCFLTFFLTIFFSFC